MYNKKTIPLLYTAVFGFILINKPIFADTDAGSLLNREEEIYKFNKNPQKIPQIDKNKKSPPVRNSQSPTIFVKDFIFKGSITKFKKEIFRNLLKNYTNKKNTFEDLKYAAYLIQELYSEKGFFLAKAFLPEQEVNNQTIIIQINEGKLDKNKPYFFKKNNVRLYEDVISSYLDDALGGNLTSQSLERGLLNLNELPGLNVTSTITTGEEQGSSKIIVDVIEDDLVTGILSYDNYGNRYTGKERANVVIDINNPSKFGDKISFIKTINSSTNYDFTKILYEFPIQQSGLRGTISYTDLDFEIGKEIKTNPVSKGTASTSNIGFVYPIQRRRESSILFRSNIERKDIYNEASGSTTNDKIIDNFNIGLTYGLGAIGSQTGGVLPAAFMEIPVSESSPIFSIMTGLSIVIGFAFILGFGATLAEPALNALGSTVQTLTNGAFKKSMLMYSVAGGVAVGIALGVSKVVLGFDLMKVLLPLYVLGIVLTIFSTEEFVNVAWDSAGVTTGPVTVPLVLAMGLGLGNAVSAIDGFGILSLASICPIVAVLSMGLVIKFINKKADIPVAV